MADIELTACRVVGQNPASNRKPARPLHDLEQRLRAWLRAFSARHPPWAGAEPAPAPVAAGGPSTATGASAVAGREVKGALPAKEPHAARHRRESKSLLRRLAQLVRPSTSASTRLTTPGPWNC